MRLKGKGNQITCVSLGWRLNCKEKNKKQKNKTINDILGISHLLRNKRNKFD